MNQPHPTRDAAGHSYGVPEPDAGPEVERLMQGDWRACPCFCYGVDLYNAAYWWEAHETWEGVWRDCPVTGQLRQVIQAFIQVSAAHLQQHVGKRGGARRLLRRARARLDRAALRDADRVAGVLVERWWRAAVEPYFAEQRAPYPFLVPGGSRA